jgi:hypothetical protein
MQQPQTWAEPSSRSEDVQPQFHRTAAEQLQHSNYNRGGHNMVRWHRKIPYDDATCFLKLNHMNPAYRLH